MAAVLPLRSLFIARTAHPRKAAILREATTKAAMTVSALSCPLTLRGPPESKTPKLVYGTAWKKERTADLVYSALKAGFRGIDTAAQPRHYQESLVGDGIRRAIKEGIVKREDLFIQTKYTPISGQDPQNIPYDASLPIAEQVKTSISSSLKNLSTGADTEAYLDSVLLHSPLSKLADTITAWRTLSDYVATGQIRHLGIANVSFPVLTYLVQELPIKPSVVQNRFYADSRYEVPLRKFCKEQGIIFQSFWTLTGNPRLLKCKPVLELAEVVGVSREVGLYALVVGLEGLSILDGTTNVGRMGDDLEGLSKVGVWAEGRGLKDWEKFLSEFKELIGEV